MANDKGGRALQKRLAELVEIENQLARWLGRRTETLSEGPLAAALRDLASVASAHRDALIEQRAEAGPDQTGSPGAASPDGGSALDALHEAAGLLSAAALRYAELTTLSFRLYSPPLRQLAPKHLRDYAEAIQRINLLIPQVVVDELREDGLFCQCVCPMCTLGACGCVAISLRQIGAAWSESAPAGDQAPGLVLQSPRPDSPLAGTGLCGGERILQVDDQPIAVFTDVQTAIQKRDIGAEVCLRLQLGELEREVRVARPAPPAN